MMPRISRSNSGDRTANSTHETPRRRLGCFANGHKRWALIGHDIGLPCTYGFILLLTIKLRFGSHDPVASRHVHKVRRQPGDVGEVGVDDYVDRRSRGNAGK